MPSTAFHYRAVLAMLLPLLLAPTARAEWLATSSLLQEREPSPWQQAVIEWHQGATQDTPLTGLPRILAQPNAAAARPLRGVRHAAKAQKVGRREAMPRLRPTLQSATGHTRPPVPAQCAAAG